MHTVVGNQFKLPQISEPTAEEVAYAATFAEAAAAAGAAADDDDDGSDDEPHDDDAADADPVYLPPGFGGEQPVAATRGISRGEGRVSQSNRQLPGGIRTLKKRLWITAESRERWHASLQGTPSAACVSLAVESLRQHCRAFGLLAEPRGVAKLSRDEHERQLHSWCHATAFGAPKLAFVAKKSKKRPHR